MKIENYKGVFHLEGDTSLSIERTNPLLSEQGSRSLPFTIKRTPHNDYLLDFPDRYDRAKQYAFKQPVNMQAGITNEIASFEMLSVNADHVEGVFYLDESSFYAQVKEIKLPQVFEGVERWTFLESIPEDMRVLAWAEMLSMMLTSRVDINDDFSVFQVATDCELSQKSAMGIVGGSVKREDLINEVVYDMDLSPVYRNHCLRGLSETTIKDSDDNIITLPIGYGITPFLRYRYILRKVFEFFDLTLETNIFDTDPNLGAWCVLNNTQDAIMKGYLIESQLVPDITVNDFLDVVREGLCGDFIIDVYRKTARLVLFNDVMAADPDIDLTAYLTSPFQEIEFAKPKQVRLTINKSLPYSETATSTIEDFKIKYPTVTPSVLEREGIFSFNEQNSYWKIYDPVPGWMWSTFKTDWIGSMNFDYDPPAEYVVGMGERNKNEIEDHQLPMEALGSVKLRGSFGQLLGYVTPLVGDSRNLNSYIILDGTKQTEDKVECPFMISVETKSSLVREGIQTGNRQMLSDPTNGVYKDLSSILLWGDFGLYSRYWQRYDLLCRTSFHSITYQARVPSILLHKFRFDRKKIINGQPLIPVSLKYEMSDDDCINVEMLFKTVKEYR